MNIYYWLSSCLYYVLLAQKIRKVDVLVTDAKVIIRAIMFRSSTSKL